MTTINDYPAFNNSSFSTLIFEDCEIEIGTLEIAGTGDIRIRNTGGSSASEGGMGSGGDDEKVKGDLTKQGGGTGTSKSDDSDITFDPLKKEAREETEKASERGT